MRQDKQQLFNKLVKLGILPSKELNSIILVGGLGKRLNDERKLISLKNFSNIDKKFYNQYGPKGMAILNLAGGNKTITDKHLAIHRTTEEVSKITLALGCQADIFQDYYKSDNLDFLIEKKPAGTIAALVKLWISKLITTEPLIYANGDNLIEIDFYKSYLQGLYFASKLGIDINNLVINILTRVPYKDSVNYGIVNLDATNRIKNFIEKKSLQSGRDLDKLVLINSGFSIICNPQVLLSNHLDKEVFKISQALEEGQLKYSHYEKFVKYEIFYEKISKLGLMVGIVNNSYWTDLGTEEKLVLAENYFNSLN